MAASALRQVYHVCGRYQIVGLGVQCFMEIYSTELSVTALFTPIFHESSL